ncbi:hypothetical protein IGI04_014695 [Brassica rapa subsp. trilocularis]|uniref:Uncharacterized protein n=1 Tax=Brassica rapa subsp. trilocularis TaxID=1813537 RepID=A0ABQ7MMX7_BRACM|nr:hypothetical protein IGI04_014695 [Brassica rapa subsp. trilocularis]
MEIFHIFDLHDCPRKLHIYLQKFDVYPFLRIKFDGSVKWYGCGTRELALRNWRECKVLGCARWLMSETVRSLRSDRTNGLVGRYVATDE